MTGRKAATVKASTKAKKKKRPKQLVAEVAHDCAVLSVDAAERSGWAIWDRGNLRTYGECDVFGVSPAEVIALFKATTAAPHVICIERPFRIRFGSQCALGAGEKIWRKRAEHHGFAKRVVRVYPSTWRSKSLGSQWVSAKRDLVRAQELVESAKIVAKHLGASRLVEHPVGDESAPAILIGKWACFASETLATLPKAKPPKVIKPEAIKFGRFAIRSKPRKRIERATGGDQSIAATWLVIGGRVPKRSEPILASDIETAQIKLGFTCDMDRSTASDIEHFALVPYQATSAEIEAGWALVADSVERVYGKPSRKKGKAAA